MKRIYLTSLLCTSIYLLFNLQQSVAATYLPLLPTEDTCLVKTEISYDFPESMHQKVQDVIEDKLAGGIEDGGKVIWENSPDAPEYYQVVLRKTKVTIKYKGIVCQDRLIWQNIEDCKTALKKLLNI